ncbi:MAG: UDP-N-acetylmuramate dehydrogenase [Devosia sp.]|uniref:UDP-N-acetylmuramate dehydrogenase n=1 Tax=Devosia sp. TaxID=1871048 RepID=UPI0024CD6E33|nr:UDP-N-acetylmuramate dehydrogenase [Devosia sp.]UYO00172.1 MAG: UDP-N-acetylmuramate dehydrogenase [Devosia sp.]
MTLPPLALTADFDLTGHNTLALKARSRFGCVLERAEQVPHLFALAAADGLPVRILGGGSNVVLSETFDGITAVIGLRGLNIVTAGADSVLIEAAAGELWDNLVRWTVGQGYGGIENLVSIPGTVGAAPVQNIGAYGAELADVFENLVAFDRERGAEVTLDRADCAFGYRDSLFKRQPGRYVITLVRLRLNTAWAANLGFAGLADLAGEATLSPAMVMERVAAIRASKLPDWRVEPNAGSFFQNPIVPADLAEAIVAAHPGAPNFVQPDGRRKLSAGWLIENAGLKGFELGPVGTSARHALVVVNRGGGSAEDIRTLAGHIRTTVFDKFGVTLAEEPIFF